jgi:hypothetical protein
MTTNVVISGTLGSSTITVNSTPVVLSSTCPVPTITIVYTSGLTEDQIHVTTNFKIKDRTILSDGSNGEIVIDKTLPVSIYERLGDYNTPSDTQWNEYREHMGLPLSTTNEQTLEYGRIIFLAYIALLEQVDIATSQDLIHMQMVNLTYYVNLFHLSHNVVPKLSSKDKGLLTLFSQLADNFLQFYLAIRVSSTSELEMLADVRRTRSLVDVGMMNIGSFEKLTHMVYHLMKCSK